MSDVLNMDFNLLHSVRLSATEESFGSQTGLSSELGKLQTGSDFNFAFLFKGRCSGTCTFCCNRGCDIRVCTIPTLYGLS